MKTFAKIAGTALGALVLLVAAYTAATWAPDRPVSELAARWAPPPSTFLRVAGMNVHLRDEGPRSDPVPIVLLHGTSSSLHTWEGWAEALRGEHRVIRFDLPGFGLTGPSPDGDYSMPTTVRFVGAVLDELHVKRCVLAGNSLGGGIAWRLALERPGLVERLVLVDASGYPLHSQSIPIGLRIAQTPLLNRLAKVTLPRRVVESSLRDVYGDPKKVTPALVDRYFELTLRQGNRSALRQRFAQRPKVSDAGRIPELKLPTLVLWGERDRLIPLADGEHFHRDIAGSRLEVFEELGHVPQEEDPARTVAVVKRFLASP